MTNTGPFILTFFLFIVFFIGIEWDCRPLLINLAKVRVRIAKGH